MKIEMGESLFYSWLRHVKECQIVQTNWKVSPLWEMQHETEIHAMMENFEEHFLKKYNYQIFKKNSSMQQIINQGECDVIGISFDKEDMSYYAVDVAFHENGLNYGSREETVMKVIAKCIRTAMCLYGYMDAKGAEIIFASPKINPAVYSDLEPCIEDLNKLFEYYMLDYRVRLIANETFDEKVLKPILLASDGIADTSELFLRSYQMYKMFSKPERVVKARTTVQVNDVEFSNNVERAIYTELKIGKLVKSVLQPLIIQKATSQEIEWMQDAGYSKANFDIQYPLLLKTKSPIKEKHYYKDLLYINGDSYRLCCEWFETEVNNDRTYVESWIEKLQSR